jgi:hypothetical protein
MIPREPYFADGCIPKPPTVPPMFRLNLESRACRRAMAAILVFMAGVGALSHGAARGQTKRVYDLPPVDATQALKLFSEQSGRGVIAGTEVVRGIRTKPVRGEFTPLEALSRMLAGTGLKGIEDPDSGTFAVRRENGEERKRGEPPASRPPRASGENTELKSKATAPAQEPSARRAGLLARLATAIAVAGAPDSAAAAQATDAGPPGVEDPVVLSPFMVTSERDSGYLATSTLAGTRLNTPIEDIGASISIYTKDFLQDIGATDLNELLIYATGVEAAGPQGNFSGAVNSINAGSFTDGEVRMEPLTGIRTRGLGRPTITRGFFLTDIPSDSYNSSRVTVNNGPNAILFGVGNPAGVVDTTIVGAEFGHNTNRVETRVGDHGSVRGSLDINRVVVPGKVAARLATMYDRNEFDQRPAFEERRRLFGAITVSPFKTTQIRANLETGRTRANRPFTVLPYDATSVWMQSGRPVHDWTFYDDPARNPNARDQNVASQLGFLIGQGNIGNVILFGYSDPNGVTPDVALTNRIDNQVNANVVNPQVNRDLGADDARFWSTLNISNLASAWWPEGQEPPGIKAQGFVNRDAFDWAGRQVAEGGYQHQTFHTFNVAFEQRAWRDRLGIEVAFDRQRHDRRNRGWFTSNNNASIMVDTNVSLITGEPNPNLGRPYSYVYGQTDSIDLFSEREGLRATAFLKYDFQEVKRPWTRWLGRHVLTGLYERNTADTMRVSNRLASEGLAARQLNANISTAARRPAVIVYMGPSLVGNNNPLRLEPIRIPFPQAGPTPPVTYFVRARNAFESSPTELVDLLSGGQAQREVIKSHALALQSYWLKEHLVTLAGWRRDQDYLRQINLNTLNVTTDSNDPGRSGGFGFDEFNFERTPPPNDSAEIFTYSGVLRWPNRLLRLPGDADARIFYNVSENFAPTNGLVDAFNNPLASPQGETKEYGLHLALFSRKLSLRLNHFETSIVGQPIASPYRAASYANVAQVASFWAVEPNKNPQNVAFMNAAVERMFSALPAGYRDLYEFRVFGEAPNLSFNSNALAGLSDTTDFTAKGTEISVVYNPTRNWRMMVNVARQETVQSNTIPLTQAFVDLMLPVWNSSVTDPTTGLSVPLRDIPRGGYDPRTGPANPNPAAPRFGQFLDNEVLIPLAAAKATEGVASVEQRKWRVNVVTNYTFRRDALGGMLRGWAVGGGLRWQSRLGLGYPTTRDAEGIVTFDLANPYYAPEETNVDGWISYSRRIWKDRIDWKAQLNVRNVIGDDDLIGITVQPWGDVARVRIPPERSWYLTNTFSF